jgi:dTDP-4-dehydrorhamnose reductase
MLGSMILKTLNHQEPDWMIATPPRKLFDIKKTNLNELTQVLAGYDWVINAAGIIKPHIVENNRKSVENAVQVNSIFPLWLGWAASDVDAKVIQIATDCVYSGGKGSYIETDKSDAHDIYGKTKSIGEINLPNFYNLRCSIIGPEQKSHQSLMDWFLGQPEEAEVNGFTNHEWNGITTYHFARICQGIIKNNPELPHLQHIVPSDSVNKFALLKAIAKHYDRKDIKIEATEAGAIVNRTLATKNGKLNKELWELAGYYKPPTIKQMISELRNIS